MSDFHYVRTLGNDGGVDACTGPAIGLDLESVLADGLPPFKVCLQIIAGLCEILDIAEEDREVHGDIDPKYIFMDDTGAISLEGFGQARSRAPEGRPKGPATDLYGLGIVAFRLFSFGQLPKLSNDDADTHDDAVIDAVLTLRFDGLNEEMVGDVQWFLAKLLSFDREERPTAVETWRTFLAYAEEARGPDFVQWCLDALDAGGERRALEAYTEPTHTGTGLKGPSVKQGPLAAGGLAFGGGAAAAGGTAFFSKDEMKAALEQNNRAEAFRPAPGGGSATNFWSRDELAAMADDANAAPRPKRAAGEGEKRKTMALSKGDLERADRPRGVGGVATAQPPKAPPAPPPSPPVGQFADDSFHSPEPTVRMKPNVVRTLTPAPAPQVFRPPGNRQPSLPETSAPHQKPAPSLASIDSDEGSMLGEATVVQTQKQIQAALAQERARVNASMPPAPSPMHNRVPEPVAAPPPEESRTNILLIAGIAFFLVVAMIACSGLGGLGAFVALVSGGAGGSSANVAQEAPAPPPLPVQPKDGVASAEPGSDTKTDTPKSTKPSPSPKPRTTPKPRPSPRPTRPSPSPSPRPSPRPGPKPSPAPAPVAPAPAPAPPPVATGPVTLTLKTNGRGRLKCPGVANKAFDGNTSMNIEGYALPATCLVIIDKARDSFQVFGTGAVTCNQSGANVSCSPRRVGG